MEINDDDHGKAILVFTIVTLVFLPLSFVTSFLGVNTVDIRNQTSTQSLFWIVALPIISVVVVVALIIGYKYEGSDERVGRDICWEAEEGLDLSGTFICSRLESVIPVDTILEI